MRLDSIALKNLGRRKAKLVFLLLGITMAIGTVVTMYSIITTMNVKLADTFDEIGANIIVVPKDEDTFTYGGFILPGTRESGLKNDDVIAINTIPNRENIATVSPKALGLMEIKGQRVMAVGVDFPSELRLKRWWTWIGEQPNKMEDLLVGSRAARTLGLQPGDTINVGEQTLVVRAVLAEQGTEEDGLVFANLLAVQQMTGRVGVLDMIEVAAYCTTCPVEEIARQIGESIPAAKVTPLAEAVRARRDVVDKFTSFAIGVSAVVGLIGFLVVMLTMLSSVTERTREIGIYRAIGYRRSHIYEIVLTEATLVGLLGGLLGYAGGTLAARLAGPGIAGMAINIPWNPWLGAIVIIGGVLVALAASAYPSRQAANLDPAEALRFI